MYILECSNGAYYTVSTKYMELRLKQHQSREGANFTRKHLPVKLVYLEIFDRIDKAFYREKQVQGWSRRKKEALIYGNKNLLHELAACKNETHFRNVSFGSAQETGSAKETSSSEETRSVKEIETGKETDSN
ncbi:MAG: GIY-YIG nuclease family protein [Bacteroidetes bacterium]|nr:GIY-YIG nuclease family protein [Bacteroidota bacterium]